MITGVIIVRPPGVTDAEWARISADLAQLLYAVPATYVLGVEQPADARRPDPTRNHRCLT